MKTWTSIFLTLAAGTAHCQTPSILIEACNEIKDTNKRLECLKAALTHNTTPSNEKSSVNIESVASAFSKMESNLSVGLSYNAYKSALLDLAATVAEYKRVSKHSQNEKGLDLIEKSIDAYKDAATFWDYSIKFNSNPSNNRLYNGAIPTTDGLASQLISKYQTPTAAGDFLGITHVLKKSQTLSSIWEIAKKYSSLGIEEIKSPTLRETKTPNEDPKKIFKDGQSWIRPIESEIKHKNSTPPMRVEFSVLPGASVKAAASGKVVYSSDKLIGYGNLIIIRHDEKYLTAYYFNKRNLVHDGDYVQQGQDIAECGETLGYEVREKGVAIDPEPFIPAM